MPGHGDEVRPQLLKVQREQTGRLGGVHDQGLPVLPAELRQGLDGQNVAEDVGDVGADRRVRLRQQPLRLRQKGFGPEQGRAHAEDFRSKGVEGPEDCVVLIAGGQHPAFRQQQGVNGDVETVGGVEGEHHLLRLGHMKQAGQPFPAEVAALRRRQGGTVGAPAGGGHASQRRRHRFPHRRRLVKAGGGAVQIDHGATSRRFPRGSRA